VDVNGTGRAVGGLVGFNEGSIFESHSSGSVSGAYDVGGLIGWSFSHSAIIKSHSNGQVSGDHDIGG